jgi:bacterial/archaeal transporter family-2 protein
VRPAGTVLATAAAFAVGAIVALQARFNGDLAVHLGGGFPGGSLAATINFAVGLTALSLCLLVARSQRTAVAQLLPALRTRRLSAWQCLGGLGGSFLILSQSATVPTIGVAVFTVAVVGGQTVSGLLVDKVGLGPAGRQPVTARRTGAAALAVAAVVVAVSGHFGSGSFAFGLVVLCVAAGAAVSVQSALNGQVGRATGSAVAASWLNFAVGFPVLLLVVAALLSAGTRYPAPPHEWWLYTGGLFGVAFVTVVAAVVRTIGVLVVTLATVAGQVFGAVLLDAVAPVAGQSLQLVTVLGAVATLSAVLLAVRSRP